MTPKKPLVVITGASSGIGAATAREFSAAGHPLLLVARRRDRLDALGLPHTITRGLDITDRQAFEGAVAEAEAVYGPVDLLVNNAGLMPLARFSEQDPAEWKALFDVNCLALLQATQVVLPAMIARHGGTIVNLGSIAGRNLYANHTVYCGTKFAVHAMTEGLRREVAASGVRVILVSPGMVETELLESTTSSAIKADYLDYKRSIGGALPPQEVARVMLAAYQLPQSVCVREIVFAPTTQDS